MFGFWSQLICTTDVDGCVCSFTLLISTKTHIIFYVKFKFSIGIFILIDIRLLISMRTHIIFDVRFAPCPEDDSTRFVVAILAAEVEGRESSPISEIKIWPILAEGLHGSAEPFPGGLVKGRVPVLKVEKGKLSFLLSLRGGLRLYSLSH
jgi:hypothetical protein